MLISQESVKRCIQRASMYPKLLPFFHCIDSIWKRFVIWSRYLIVLKKRIIRMWLVVQRFCSCTSFLAVDEWKRQLATDSHLLLLETKDLMILMKLMMALWWWSTWKEGVMVNFTWFMVAISLRRSKAWHMWRQSYNNHK